MRLIAAIALAVTLVAAAAEAAISPVFDRERAQSGDTVTLVLGPGSEAFRAPLRFALVAADLELSLTGPEDPRPVPIGDIGTPGELDVPDRYPFVVPDIAPGEYVAVLWSSRSAPLGGSTSPKACAWRSRSTRLTIRRRLDGSGSRLPLRPWGSRPARSWSGSDAAHARAAPSNRLLLG